MCPKDKMVKSGCVISKWEIVMNLLDFHILREVKGSNSNLPIYDSPQKKKSGICDRTLNCCPIHKVIFEAMITWTSNVDPAFYVLVTN